MPNLKYDIIFSKVDGKITAVLRGLCAVSNNWNILHRQDVTTIINRMVSIGTSEQQCDSKNSAEIDPTGLSLLEVIKRYPEEVEKVFKQRGISLPYGECNKQRVKF